MKEKKIYNLIEQRPVRQGKNLNHFSVHNHKIILLFLSL